MPSETFISNLSFEDDCEALIPFYQPIIDKDNRLVGYEVLARRRTYRKNNYLVINFLTLSSEEVLRIDIAMLKAVLNDLPLLERASIGTLSINLNPDLECPAYLELLLQVVLDSKRVGIGIWLEVLESVNLKEHQKGMLALMRMHGAKIVCDDFGTSACNFQRILEFPYEIIKLDRSLLLETSQHSHAFKMLSGLIQYLQAVNVQVVCEGVETNAHIQIASQLGCDYQQGYIYGMPAPLLSQIPNASLIIDI